MEKRKAITDPFFPVKVEPVETVDRKIIVPRKAILNADTDQVISVVSPEYEVIPNSDLVKDFEEYFTDSDVRFERLSSYCNPSGTRFFAKYRFPDEKVIMKTQIGDKTVNDEVQLMLNLFGSYDGSSKHGFDVGGYRLICLNGLRAFKKLFRWAYKHVGQEDLRDIIFVSFETVREIFKNDLAPSWEQLTQEKFDKLVAAQVLRSLELSKLYRKWMGNLYRNYQQEQRLSTMWDFYNMITYFVTHIVERRNHTLAQQMNVKAWQELTHN